jgi:hypothetical protein
MTPRTANRIKLLAVLAFFAAPIAVVLALKYGGYQPVASRNHGALVEPALDFRAVAAYGETDWKVDWANPEGRFRVLVPLPAPCDARCRRMVDSMQRVYVGLGRRAGRVDVLFAGLPDEITRMLLERFPQARVIALDDVALPAATAPAPGDDALAPLPAYVVDPHGYLILRYDPGFDPLGLRADLAKLAR